MKHLLLTTLVIASFSGLANASDGIYASVKSGISDTKVKSNSLDFYDPTSDLNGRFEFSNQTKSVYPTISAAVGYDFSKISNVNARAELEYTYKNSTSFNPQVVALVDLDTGERTTDGLESNSTNKLTTQSLMLNGYYDFKNQTKFTPYISAGVGFTHVKNKQSDEDYSTSDSDNHFTWSAGVGVAYHISNNVALDASYRYVDAGKFKFTDTQDGEFARTNMKLSSNDYLLGIRYNF